MAEDDASKGALGRRRFLIGAGGLVAVAAAGLAGVDLAAHTLFEQRSQGVGRSSSPDRQLPPSGATEESGRFASRHMRGEIGWTVSRPAGSGSPSGVVVCLHGFGGNHRYAFDQVHVPDAAASVGMRVAVAAVDGGADSYWHGRADGTDAQSMLLREFIPMLQARFGDVPYALMGWSMGGYGALLAAERFPSTFVGVAPASPALWLTPSATAAGAFDSPADFYANDVFTHVRKLRSLVVAVACGKGDPFYAATRNLVGRMDFPHHEFFGAGYHDAAFWRRVAPDQLRVLRPVLA